VHVIPRSALHCAALRRGQLHFLACLPLLRLNPDDIYTRVVCVRRSFQLLTPAAFARPKQKAPPRSLAPAGRRIKNMQVLTVGDPMLISAIYRRLSPVDLNNRTLQPVSSAWRSSIGEKEVNDGSFQVLLITSPRSIFCVSAELPVPPSAKER
jgi:hypothetical protein